MKCLKPKQQKDSSSMWTDVKLQFRTAAKLNALAVSSFRSLLILIKVMSAIKKTTLQHS